MKKVRKFAFLPVETDDGPIWLRFYYIHYKVWKRSVYVADSIVSSVYRIEYPETLELMKVTKT